MAENGERRAFLIFSHQLTQQQRADLHNNWQVREVIYLPPELASVWSGIPPDAVELKPLLRSIVSWLRAAANPRDLVLIQGDFGATYILVEECLRLNLIPVYSTTKRTLRENALPNGDIRQERFFKHVLFRVYGR